MKILISGSSGLVGSALEQESKNFPHEFFFLTRKDGDLTKEQDVERIFATLKPDWVIHAAAVVGGIGGNMSCQADYFYQNLLMNSYVIHYACEYNVKKLLAFSSVCVFPDKIPILEENSMHKGEPFPGNFAYAYAKRMIDVQIRAYKDQYGIKNYTSIIPGNIFGENDLYNLTHGHVLPSLIHKIYLAKKENKSLSVWGNGLSEREFIYSKDLAKILLKIIEKDEIPERIIVSGKEKYSIKEVVNLLCKVSEFKNEVVYETDKPNGQLSRPTNLKVLNELIGDFKFTDFEKALHDSYWWFEENYKITRK